ncbi:hypothetical protein PENANT_c056G08308 [Penicillium antarcticum]|uniref:Allergen Asp f 4 n=1 Tax=Penicillium antarcticum TaxID=416450 RepID=A0A1V6PQN6_9EURO|nr:uncharacterized protein N7508_011132 [Penicillium antarcticum]XP_058314215.1 uncharacterized protein N7508_011177 [Penicillium antarcticum]KAJ5288357.1 hypothetical protein N7508_011132 [Penicillium antarcticum]KAJ5288402.1 hypothetical protein N7508_011177 [Penicillium antarcticum]OQD79263.1 hypothetical protein PENANT_c056G08308 [Penicillium antarcticum]
MPTQMLWKFLILVLNVRANTLSGDGSRSALLPLLTRSDKAWTDVSPGESYSTAGFGGSTDPVGSGDAYVGNVGRPYGSNIMEVAASDANRFQYIVKFVGPSAGGWRVAIWNKVGPGGKLDGWYGNACCQFTLAADEAKYIAFATNSQGGWVATNTTSIPTNQLGSYAGTWGEFDFGNTAHNGWSGFDVSAIQAQNAQLEVQGMRICSMLHDDLCSYITWRAVIVHNAYTSSKADVGGIGGNLPAGPVRLTASIGYDE